MNYEVCDCGRTAVRMSRILGRSDDMLIIRGVNVFPSQIESAILELEEFEPHYLLIVDRVNNTDTLQVQVEVRQEFYTDEMNKLIALKKKITHRLQSVLGIALMLKLLNRVVSNVVRVKQNTLLITESYYNLMIKSYVD